MNVEILQILKPFFFGEESLKPSLVPPKLGRFTNISPVRRTALRSESIFRRRTTPLIPETVQVETTLSNERKQNIVGKLQRTNKNFKVVKGRSISIPMQNLVETTVTERESNVVPIQDRKESTVNKVDRLPVEPNTKEIQKIEQRLIIG